MCAERTGLGSRADGFFAEYMIARAAGCYVISPSVDPLAAAVTEPLACAANGLVAQANLTVGDWVVVFGPGAIGQGAARLARAAGARVILVGSAHSKPRLEIANRCGIQHTLVSHGADVLEEINRITGGQGADVAVEAVGSAEVLNTALRCLRKLGQLVLLACPMGAAQIDVVTLLLHQIRLYGAVSHGSTAWDTAVRLVNSGQVNMGPLVTDIFPLSQWDQALAKVESHEGLKVLLQP
jgi:L-iditol 2-dehydrogenase